MAAGLLGQGPQRVRGEVSKAIKWIDGRIETAVCASSAPFMDHYPQWEETVLQECFDSVDYLSMHHYHSAPPGDIRALLGGAAYYEDFINTEVALCDLIAAKCRSPKQLMLSIDEYGAMIRPNSPLHPGYGYHNMVEAHYRFDPEKKYVLHDPDNMMHDRGTGRAVLRQQGACLEVGFSLRLYADDGICPGHLHEDGGGVRDLRPAGICH